MYRYLLYFLMIFALPAQASKQALVIGNGAYPEKWALSNPVNDATDVAAALENLGFKVTVLTDKNKRSMSNAVQNFASGLQNGDVALFYFSGHGFSGKDPNARDTNFLVGSFQEMVRTRDALEEESIDASFVVRSLRSKNAQGINVMILDACRNVPTGFLEEHKGTFEEGLVSLGKYERFIMNYATQPLKKALGSKNQRNSFYTQYLVEGLKNRSLTSRNISEFFNEVGLTMADTVGNQQVPLVEMSPVRFCFAGCGGVVQQAPVVAAPAYVPPASKPARQAYEPEMVLIPADKRMEKNIISTVILAGDISFKFKMMNLSPQAIAQLSALSKAVLSDEGKRQIVLIGYTDNAECDDNNCFELADARAMTVARTLVNNGVSPKILFVKGMGQAKPIADNRTKEGRAKNRRVEIMIK